MAEPINLNRTRKLKARAQDKMRAAENRAKFGRGKTERQQGEAERERAARTLAGHKRED